jgi:uncharacterized membrane protein
MKGKKLENDHLVDKYSTKNNIYEINKSNNTNLINRLDFISLLYKTSVEKSNFLGEYRQKTFNFALVIFAALFTVILKDISINITIFSSLSLFLIMIILCLLDRRFHKKSHAWLETEKILSGVICEMINNPNMDISFMRYYKYGEKKAEIKSLQPIIYYMLIIASLLNLIIKTTNTKI